MPGTINPSPISKPDPSHIKKLGVTSVSCLPPTTISVNIAKVDIISIHKSDDFLPFFPAVLYSDGKVPATKPTNRHTNCAAYLPNGFYTTTANSTIPIAAPMATGMKKSTFFRKFSRKLARNLIILSYKPNITASTPHERPGNINPIPTSIPFVRRINQSATGFIFLCSFISSTFCIVMSSN